MNAMRERAKTHLPSMLLTLTSIVQALALELLWSKVMDAGTLHVWSLGSITGWLQAAATFTGVVLVWVLYANNIMRFRWVPSTLDSVAPFFVGLLQFLLISNIGPSSVGEWLMILAVVFSTMTFLMHRTMRAARLDPDNAKFFEGRTPATWRDFLDVAIISTVMFAAGLVVTLSGYRGLGIVALVSVSWGLLLYQLYRSHVFWRTSVTETSA